VVGESHQPRSRPGPTIRHRLRVPLAGLGRRGVRRPVHRQRRLRRPPRRSRPRSGGPEAVPREGARQAGRGRHSRMRPMRPRLGTQGRTGTYAQSTEPAEGRAVAGSNPVAPIPTESPSDRVRSRQIASNRDKAAYLRHLSDAAQADRPRVRCPGAERIGSRSVASGAVAGGESVAGWGCGLPCRDSADQFRQITCRTRAKFNLRVHRRTPCPDPAAPPRSASQRGSQPRGR
jgi:hypothetical protein